MGAFLRKAVAHAIGEIFTTCETQPPRGALACSGELVQVADYPKLYAKIGDRFAAPGDTLGGATFRLPGTEAGNPFFRQAAKVSIVGTPFDISTLAGSYDGMPGVIWTNYGHYYNDAMSEAGYADLQVFRNLTGGVSSGTFIWNDNATSTGKKFYPVLITATFDTASQTTAKVGVQKPGDASKNYWLEIDLYYNGTDTKITGMRRADNGDTSMSVLTTFYPTLASRTFAGAYVAIPLMLVMDWDALEYHYVINGTTGPTWALTDPVYYVPGPGRHTFAPYFMYQWNGGGTGHANYMPLGMNGLDGALWGGAGLTAPDGYDNVFDAASYDYWDTGATGGTDSHDHEGATGGTALTKADMPADMGIQIYEAGGSDSSFDTRADSNVNLTTGGGQTHTHTITGASHLPPFIDVLYCIQYK